MSNLNGVELYVGTTGALYPATGRKTYRLEVATIIGPSPLNELLHCVLYKYTNVPGDLSQREYKAPYKMNID